MTFVAPKRSLAGLDLDGMARCVALAADVAFVIDEDGLICDVSVSTDQLPVPAVNQWLGKTWLAVVHRDSQGKVLSLMARASHSTVTASKPVRKGKPGTQAGEPGDSGDAGSGSTTGPAQHRWRQLNHVLDGEPLPLQVLCEPIGDKGRLLVIGRDIRPVAALQQKLIEAQQSLERDYWQLRQAETRYRLLFDQSSEAILVVDADLDRVLDVNPAAARLWSSAQRRTLDGLLDKILGEAALREARTALGRVRTSGRSEELLVSDSRGDSHWRLQVSMLREDSQRSLLVRLNLLPSQAGRLATGAIGPGGQWRTAGPDGSDGEDDAAIPGQTDARTLRRLVDMAPDGFVVTDPLGNVLSANQAFADLVQMNDAGAALGESLDRWLGRSGIDLGAMLSTLKQYGSVRLFATTLRGEQGTTVEVEISAVMLPDARKSCIGFTVRHVGRRLSAGSTGERAVPRSVEQLTKLVGRMPLKDLVRESTDLIEQLCIEAALELTRDNRASAAELLGLSRQSLYVKLRRYGLGDLVPDA